MVTTIKNFPMAGIIDPLSLGLKVTRISGNEANCVCPYHDDKNQSASFNMVKGVFYCYACGTKKTAKELAEEAGVDLVFFSEAPEWNQEEEMDWVSLKSLPINLNDAYLNSKRLVSSVLIKKWSIRSNDNLVAFPFIDYDNEIKGFLTRSKTGKEYRFYGERPPVWPMRIFNRTSVDRPIIVTEGVFGALRAQAYGWNGIATMGANYSKAFQLLATRPNVFLIFDEDEAGFNGMAKAILNGIPVLGYPFTADESPAIRWDGIDIHEDFTLDIGNIIQRCGNTCGWEASRKLTKKIKKMSEQY